MQSLKEKQLKSRRLAAMVVASLVGVAVVAQTAPKVPAKPALVVGITVEGLSDTYLELLRGYFGANGFNRLMNNGVVFTDVDYGPNIDATAATAMLVSGAPASISNISAATVYDKELRRAVSILNDASTLGNFTSETLSPKALAVSTLADELRVAEGGLNGVYSIAPDAGQAIILAGHAGSGAFWINDVNGNWSTSTAYKEVPNPVNNRNFTSSLASRLDTLKWTPSIAPELYPDIPAYRKAYPFRHVFQRNNVDRYRAFKRSAPANREVTDLAADFISSMGLGKGKTTDMVSLAYNVAPYPYSKDADSRLETMDAYLRLDADLARLFATIDAAGPGMNRTLVVLAGVPAPPAGKRDEERFGVPHGVFSPRKAQSLLNVYLMALHGNGEWVAGYHNNQIYLNAALAKERDVDIVALRRESAEFLSRMAGVCRSFTLDDVLAGKAGNDAEAMRRNTVVGHSGDVFITITPGWEIEAADVNAGQNSRPMVSRLGTPMFPGFILAPGVAHRVIGTPVDATVLAPTVARILRIRSPNGAESAPLRF